MNQNLSSYTVDQLSELILNVLKNSTACSSDNPLYLNLEYDFLDYREERGVFVMHIDYYSREYHYLAILTDDKLRISDYNNFTIVSIPWKAIDAIKEYL